MKSRLFISIDLTSNFKESVMGIISENIKHFRNYKIVNKNNLHITVLFLGNTENKYIGPLVKELGPVISRISSLSMEPKEIKCVKNGKIIWLEFVKQESFTGLTESVIRTVDVFSRKYQSGINFNRRLNTLPHITLARIKNYFHPLSFPDIKLNLESAYCQKVNLMESRLKTEGAVYLPLKEFRLKK